MARTHVVDFLPGADFITITAAIDTAKPGDRILIRPGIYHESVYFWKPLEIVGDGHPGSVIIEGTEKSALTSDASHGFVSNLTLRQRTSGHTCAGASIFGGRLQIEDCDITSGSTQAVAVVTCADQLAEPILRRNHIHCSGGFGVLSMQSHPTLEENDIDHNRFAGVYIIKGGAILRRNRIHHGQEGGLMVQGGAHVTLEGNEFFANAFSFDLDADCTWDVRDLLDHRE